MNAEPPRATFTTYDALVATMRARRIELGLSQLVVDEIAGLPSGYCAKIEASLTNPTAKNARSIGRESLPLMLGALGLELAALPRSSSKNDLDKGVEKQCSADDLQSKQRYYLSRRAMLGGRARAASMSGKQRSKLARGASQKRKKK